NRKIKLDEIGVYIPDKIYSLKIEKIFQDFEIPYYTSYTVSLASLPFSKFICFLLEMDWQKASDVFRLFNSPFINFDFQDFDSDNFPVNESLAEINLSGLAIKENSFHLLHLKEVLIESNIDYF